MEPRPVRRNATRNSTAPGHCEGGGRPPYPDRAHLTTITIPGGITEMPLALAEILFLVGSPSF